MINSNLAIYFIIQLVLGIISGVFVSIATVRYKDEKKIFAKETFKDISIYFPKGYILILINILIYFLLLYHYPLANDFVSNFKLIKYMLITPLLLITFFVDMEIREIPDRVTLFLFELAIIYIFIGGYININIAKDALLRVISRWRYFCITCIFWWINSRKRSNGNGRYKAYVSCRSITWS